MTQFHFLWQQSLVPVASLADVPLNNNVTHPIIHIYRLNITSTESDVKMFGQFVLICPAKTTIKIQN